MEQRDYILREIEKIGLILKLIRNILFRKQENLSMPLNSLMEETEGVLLDKLNFKLNVFLNMKEEDSIEYIEGFKGFNANNLEQFAYNLYQIGNFYNDEKAAIYFEKALVLYELTNTKSKTYSANRETIIFEIKAKLEKY